MRSCFLRPAMAISFRRFGIFFLALFTFTLMTLSVTQSAHSAEVTLAWDPSEGAHGYLLHYGVESYGYDIQIDVGPNVRHTVTGLKEGAIYYFAVSAYNEHEESGYSTEINHATVSNIPPTANAGADMSVAELATVTLNGSDSFDPDDGIKTLYWEQISGPQVELVNQQEDICQFTAPTINSGSETLVFRLVVQDYYDQVSSTTCTVTVSAKSDPPPPIPGGGEENETAAEVIDIQKAIYKTRKARLILQANVEGGNADTVLTAWAIGDGYEIKLGNLRYRARRGYYRRAFRNMDQAPDSIVIVSNTGGEATTTCTIK